MNNVVYVNFDAKLYFDSKAVKYSSATRRYTVEFRHDGALHSFEMATPYDARLHASRAYAQLLNLDISAYDDAIGSPSFHFQLINHA